MKHPCRPAVLAAALSFSATFAQLVSAEATTTSDAAVPPTSARIDFRIDIPRVLRIRAGSAAGGIDLIDFAPGVANLADGTDVSASTGSGDPGNGAVTVQVPGNAGQVAIDHNPNDAVLCVAAAIPYTEILTASSDTTNLDAPVPGSASSPQPSLTGNLTDRTATWTYTYDNTAVCDRGVYGGVNTNGGRVTHTASAP